MFYFVWNLGRLSFICSDVQASLNICCLPMRYVSDSYDLKPHLSFAKYKGI